MTDDEKRIDEFTIKDEKDQDELRLEAIRKKFFELIFSDDGIHYDLSLIDEGLFAVIDYLRIDEKSVLNKDLELNYMIKSVCARWLADWEELFPTPNDLRNIFTKDFPSAILLLHGAIVHSGRRLARSMGYKKRAFNKEMCEFLIDNRMMTYEEYSSFKKLGEYAEEARSVLIMDLPPKEEILDCQRLYERMIFELFRTQVCEDVKRKDT